MGRGTEVSNKEMQNVPFALEDVLLFEKEERLVHTQLESKAPVTPPQNHQKGHQPGETETPSGAT